MHHPRLAALAVALVLATGRPAGAQTVAPPRPIELGVDAALSYDSADEGSVTRFSFPVPSVRLGFFIGDATSLEPFVAVTHTRVKDDDDTVPGGDDTFSFTSYNLGLGLLFHFSADRTRAQTFLRPFAGVSGSRSDGGSASQPFLGAALGLKTANADRLAARFEAGFEHRFEDDPGFESSNRIFLSLGFSFFTR